MKKSILPLIVSLVFPLVANAQEGQAAPPLQIRSMLHDPVNPVADLFVADKSGRIVKLDLAQASLGQPQITVPQNGNIVLYDKAAVDPQKPQASLAGSVKVPAGCTRCILILLRNEADKKPGFKVLALDDGPKGFPKGETRVLSLLPVDTAMEAGEHKLSVPSGKITSVPAVKKVNEFNMAQMNFYYKEGPQWMPFSERQIQFLDEFRRIIVLHVTPGATFPLATTVVDTAPPPIAVGNKAQ